MTVGVNGSEWCRQSVVMVAAVAGDGVTVNGDGFFVLEFSSNTNLDRERERWVDLFSF